MAQPIIRTGSASQATFHHLPAKRNSGKTPSFGGVDSVNSSRSWAFLNCGVNSSMFPPPCGCLLVLIAVAAGLVGNRDPLLQVFQVVGVDVVFLQTVSLIENSEFRQSNHSHAVAFGMRELWSYTLSRA